MGSSQWYEKPARGPAAVQGDRPTPQNVETPEAGWTAGPKPEAHPTRRRTRARDRCTELRLAALCH